MKLHNRVDVVPLVASITELTVAVSVEGMPIACIIVAAIGSVGSRAKRKHESDQGDDIHAETETHSKLVLVPLSALGVRMAQGCTRIHGEACWSGRLSGNGVNGHS